MNALRILAILILFGPLQSGAASAVIRVNAQQQSEFAIPKFITGKFAEHLGFNIYNGMDAQILRNPTFADYPFSTGQMTPDGVTEFQSDEKRFEEELRRQARRFGWPSPVLDGLVRAHRDALAAFWGRAGSPEQVLFSPDVGPFGGRAQRVELKDHTKGIGQWTWLPLHRQRQFEFELLVRSPGLKALTVSLWPQGAEKPAASQTVEGLSGEWKELRGTLTMPDEYAADRAYELTITGDRGQFVIGHAFLRPADHVHGADPEIIKFLRESRLPILRWPGGNFVSTYHWQDAVGPIAQRPTKPNYAWGAIEPNTFGTAEFITFCHDVGCEPMICINAGSGTPAEAAQWIEYCNGSAETPMGRLRAAHGYAEPFHVRHWEVGNELWGHWQMDWTTASGYVDRYERFAPAMMAADPAITLYACGAPAMSGKAWNDTLISGLGASLVRITDHPLIGGDVPVSTDPLDVYRDFMAVPQVLEQKWTELRDSMRRGGVREPKLAVTELQLFAHLARDAASNAPVRLRYDTLPSQGSITEALYDILIYHAAIRLQPFVELVTHSAVVNHGGGLRKERERVWANPCHDAQSLFAAFANGRPVAVEVECPSEDAPMVLPDLKKATAKAAFRVIDTLGAVAPDGGLLLSIVHRGTSGPIHIRTELAGFRPSGQAEVRTLSAKTAWEGNSLEEPGRIHPIDSTVPIQDGVLELDLAPFTYARVHVAPKF